MRTLLGQFGLRFTTGHALGAAALIPACLALFLQLDLLWVGITIGVLIALGSVLTIRGRRLTGWVAALFSWRRRHRTTPELPSEPAVGATVMPADHVAVRWQGGHLVSVIELVPRPFTPTVVVNGQAFTDDVLDTRLVERLVEAHCPDLEVDVVSAGYRVGKTAPASLVALYDQVVGPYPAPANRRTWIVLRADPEGTQRSSQRRDTGVAGLARYLVASTTRIADQLSGNGIDARCSRSFDDYDRATEISFERETWSSRCRAKYTGWSQSGARDESVWGNPTPTATDPKRCLILVAVERSNQEILANRRTLQPRSRLPRLPPCPAKEICGASISAHDRQPHTGASQSKNRRRARRPARRPRTRSRPHPQRPTPRRRTQQRRHRSTRIR